jgi:hypothetical protein
MKQRTVGIFKNSHIHFKFKVHYNESGRHVLTIFLELTRFFYNLVAVFFIRCCLGGTTLGIMTLNVMTKLLYCSDEGHYGEWHYAKSYHVECHFADGHYSKYSYDECRKDVCCYVDSIYADSMCHHGVLLC